MSFTFSEAMDTGTTPTVTFAPAVASTLTNQSGAWLSDGKTYKVQATIDDQGIDANEVKIDITGAKDAAGNLQVDHTATVGLGIDTLNPTATYSSEIKNQNTNGAADVASDADTIVAYTVDFSEPVSGIAETDIAVAGGAVVTGTVALSEDKMQATFDVQASDDSDADLVVKVKSTVTDLNGNKLIETSSEAVTVDTRNPGVVITDDQSGIAFDGDNSVAYTLTFSEAVQAIDADDLTVTGATVDSVDHTAGSKTATVTVTVTDDSMSNVSITAKPSIVDIAGNPLVQAVDDSQTVDTRNPSTEGAPKVSDVLITDADANGDGGPSTLSVSFTFNEAMDTGTAPTVTFDPAVASTLTGQSGAWQSDGKTYKVEATVADDGVDA
ncbi:MAG: Ig-like domain-containing protein, partial [Pseudomonadota bacterium]|nr:Ig-like domain-containing protein [Pseudomonadota bacterium]